MARRADPPRVQRAKGNPGRRKSAVAKREEEIARVAEILAGAVWKLLAPRLASTLRLQDQHRPIFAMFCVYFAEWVAASEDVIKNGSTQSVATVAGPKGATMERIRPIVKIRDAAFDQVLKLSARFGLTPSDEYALFKEQQLAAALNPGLFDSVPPRPGQDRPADEPDPASGSAAGMMRSLDSTPPSLN